MSDIIITSELLETKIREGLTSVDFVKAVDESSGCGAKFEIEIVSSDFKGKPLLAQHRMIHKILEVERKSIHALTLKTKAPSSSSTSSSAPVESKPVVITDVTAESKSYSHGECQGHTAGHDHAHEHHSIHSHEEHAHCTHVHEHGHEDHVFVQSSDAAAEQHSHSEDHSHDSAHNHHSEDHNHDSAHAHSGSCCGGH